MPPGRRSALALVAALVAVGCATEGRRFDTDSIPRLVPGRSTQEQVRELFGEPVSVRTRGTGGSTWRYDFRETSTADTGMFTRMGNWLAWLFGMRGVRAPANVQYSNTVRHRLTAYFESDGVLRDYEYDRTETPSKRVY